MIRIAAGIVVLLLLLAGARAALSHFDPLALRAAFAQASWTWAAAGAVVNLLSIVADAARWRAILAGVRRVSMLAALEALLLGWLSNLVLPLKLGEGAKAWVMARRHALPLATVMSTVLLDRAVDVVSLVLFIALTSTLAPLPERASQMRALGLAAVGGLGLGLVLARRSARRRAWTGAGGDGIVARVMAGLAVLGHQHRLNRILGIALVSWFLRMGVVWCALQAFTLRLPMAAAASVLVAINLGIAAVSVPANIGVFELSAVAGLALWNVPSETALGVGILVHAVELVPTVALALIASAVTGTALPRGPMATQAMRGGADSPSPTGTERQGSGH